MDDLETEALLDHIMSLGRMVDGQESVMYHPRKLFSKTNIAINLWIHLTCLGGIEDVFFFGQYFQFVWLFGFYPGVVGPAGSTSRFLIS